MKILYLGCFCEPTQRSLIDKLTGGRITVSTTTFQLAFLSGFLHLSQKLDYIINVPDIGSFPLRCKSPFIPRSNFRLNSIEGLNGSFLNLTFFKGISIYNSLVREASAWLEANKGERVTILVYSCIYPYIKAAVELKKRYSNVQICCIVLDLPEYFGDSTSFVHRFFESYYSKKIYSLCAHVDSFILLTEFMKDKIEVGHRPWLLLEGLYNPVEVADVPKRSKTILYTGKLDARFGIRSLIEAFMAIDDDDFVLWICGFGSDAQYVEAACRQDNRIKYWGLVDQSRVFRMQKEASLLINPRKPEGEYTKYSFPSKTMEYMASGTPTIMYDLPGLPLEYKEYLILVPDTSIEMLSAVMYEWGSKSSVDLTAFGCKAKRFILENKNSAVQARRVMDFLHNLNE